MLKKMLPTLMVGLSAFAANADVPAKSHNDPCASAPCVDSGVPNPSARTTVNCSNFYLFADFLYWQVKENGTTWAYVQPPTETLNEFQTQEKQVNFGFDPGFRAGVGYDMRYDQWDTKVYYTWYQTSKSDNATVNHDAAALAADGLLPDFGTGGYIFSFLTLDYLNLNTSETQFISADIDWKVRYSMFDWDLGRHYHVSKHFTMRPNVGLKGGWINQKVDAAFNTLAGPLTSVQVDAKNNFWGIGPSGGVDAKWLVGNARTNAFSLFGDFQAALLWSHFDLSYKLTSLLPPDVTNQFTGLNTNQITPTLRTVLGMGWDTNFNTDWFHFGAKLGYELQYWWNQNYVTSVFTQARDAQDLALHGLTLDLRFDF